MRGAALGGREPPGMLLRSPARREPLGHRPRLVELAGSTSASTSSGATGNAPGSSDPSRSVCSQTAREARRPPARARARAAPPSPRARSASSMSQRTPPVRRARSPPSPNARPRSASPRRRRAARGSARTSARAAARRSDDLRPLVEQPLGLVPVARPQLELAQVQALQRVRGRLAPLVGDAPAAASAPRARAPISPRHTSRWPAMRSGDSCDVRGRSSDTPRKRSHSSSTGAR